MFRSPSRHRFARVTLWVAMCLLLLKAAMPMLATASAQAQGKTLVEVCTVYGVAMVALDGSSDTSPAGGDHAASGHAESCALNALTALATPPAPTLEAFAHPVTVGWVPLLSSAHNAPDACALWVARQKQGPPVIA